MRCPNADGTDCELAACEQHGNIRPLICPAEMGLALARGDHFSKEEARRYLDGNGGMIFMGGPKMIDALTKELERIASSTSDADSFQ